MSVFFYSVTCFLLGAFLKIFLITDMFRSPFCFVFFHEHTALWSLFGFFYYFRKIEWVNRGSCQTRILLEIRYRARRILVWID